MIFENFNWFKKNKYVDQEEKKKFYIELKRIKEYLEQNLTCFDIEFICLILIIDDIESAFKIYMKKNTQTQDKFQ